VIGHLNLVRAAIVALTMAVPLLPSPSAAQGSGEGFLFEQPVFQVGIRGGYNLSAAGGGVLDHARDQLTLGKRDFDGSAWGLELAARVRERMDVSLDVRFTKSQRDSEMRDWVDLDDLPIEQTTSFTRVPISLNAKFYLADRGRGISEFVWIPEKWAPFVGAGGGFTWYEFGQKGDFVDVSTLDILYFALKSSGWAPSGHVFAGVDISMSPRLFWTLEGRYGFGGADTSAAFAFDQIDVSGLQATIGLSARF
jgi:hypothetical protein